jgi:hypothetical protein
LDVDVGQECVEIAVPIKIAEGDGITLGVPEGLPAVEENPLCPSLRSSLVEVNAVRLEFVGDEGVEIAVPVKIAEGDVPAEVTSEGLPAVEENPLCPSLRSPLIDPDPVLSVLEVGDEGVEIAVSVKIAEGDAFTVAVSEGLPAVQEDPRYPPLVTPLVEIDAVRLVLVVGYEGIKVAVPVEIAEGDVDAGGISEGLPAV